jgi:hypothetical protein
MMIVVPTALRKLGSAAQLVAATALAIVFLIAPRSESALLPKVQPTPPIKAFLAWRDAIGLKDVFEFEEEASQANSCALTLSAGNLETAVGQESAELLYTRLFMKLLTFVETSPEKVQLCVDIRVGDYCDAAIVRKTVQLTSIGITINTTRIRGPLGLACMLDFEAVRRYEEATKTAAAGVSTATSKTASAGSTLVASTDAIHRAVVAKYAKRGASILVTGMTAHWFSIVVRHLRGEVISGRQYWERLQLLVFLEPMGNATVVRLIVDGKYGAGLAPPDDLGYSDMEPIYTANLTDYGKALVLYLAEVQ